MPPEWPERVLAADASGQLVACFWIEFEPAIQSRAQHAVMKVCQPQNMPLSVLPKPNPKLFRKV